MAATLETLSDEVLGNGAPRRPMIRLALVATMISVVLAVQRTAHASTAPLSHAQSAPPPVEVNLGAQGNLGFIDRIFRQGLAEFNAGNPDAAVNLWELAAQQGHLLAQYNLGIAYAKGLGTRMDIGRAVHWWREAATQGSTDAQYNLGALYAEGNGVEKNMSEASIWWRLAAQGGDAAAQFNLGLLLARGDGVPQDLERAIWWWEKSAAQGFQHAIRALDTLKKRGVSLYSPGP